MDNALLIAVNVQDTLRQRMDIVANNLANMNTAAFKAEVALNSMVVERPSEANDVTQDIRFTDIDNITRDMRTGNLKLTGGDLDVALENPNAFFSVRVGADTFYTRDGQFALDELSRLVTREGGMVLDAAGAEMVFDPEGGPPQITEGGFVRQGDVEIGKLGVFGFETPVALEKIGSNLWTAGDQAPEAVDLPQVRQGFVEQSNVNAVLEITRMIEISRAYSSASRLVQQADQLRKDSISKLGGTQ